MPVERARAKLSLCVLRGRSGGGVRSRAGLAVACAAEHGTRSWLTRLVNVHYADELLVAAGVAKLFVALHHAQEIQVRLNQAVDLPGDVVVDGA